MGAGGRGWWARAARLSPAMRWARRYTRAEAADDLIAAAIVTVMLAPQSLAYAMLAGLPPEYGLYASILPLLAYAVFGGSAALAVGPVAVVSLMTAQAVGDLDLQSDAARAEAAGALALLVGGVLLAMSALKLGLLANFLSRPVVGGFISAAAILIALGQVKYLAGVSSPSDTLPAILHGLWLELGRAHLLTLAVGLCAVAALLAARRFLKPALLALGASRRQADIAAKATPALVVALAGLAAYLFDLGAAGVALVGAMPSGLPSLGMPSAPVEVWRALAPSAALIALVGFVESVSVAQSLGARRREAVEPDQELIGLGAANVASAASGGFPITGGFARSVVNVEAGAATPAAGAFTAVGMLVATLFLTPLLFFLPKAALAAVIIVAVAGLIELEPLRRAYAYSPQDFAAVAATMAATLLVGVELGVGLGVALSLTLFLRRTARPHIAEVGLVRGTEHFRNVERHGVLTSPRVLMLRVDESLYFANARFLEDEIQRRAAREPALEHVILMASAVNDIDLSALESLEEIMTRLASGGVKLHLAEVKGPVMDKLARSDFLRRLTGDVFLTQYQAATALCPLFRTGRAPQSAA